MSRPIIFMIMPFEDEFLELFSYFKNEFKDEYEFTHAGDLENQQSILKDIVDGVSSSDVVIADLSGLNPNVFYELGLAHAMNKKVVIITQSIEELPFDLKQYRANEYSTAFNKVELIKNKIQLLIEGALKGTTQFGSPVSDYAPEFNIRNLASIDEAIETEELELRDKQHEEKGFLDLQAEVEEDISSLTESITAISNEMNILNERTKEKNEEIDKVASKGGSGSANYMRGMARKIADDVNAFGDVASPNVKAIAVLWDQIENNLLHLLDNEFIYGKSNKEDIMKLLQDLDSMIDAIEPTKEKIKGFVNTMNGLTGVERRLNQAVKGVEECLNGLLTNFDQMSAGIARIQGKGEMLIS